MTVVCMFGGVRAEETEKSSLQQLCCCLTFPFAIFAITSLVDDYNPSSMAVKISETVTPHILGCQWSSGTE